MMFFTIEAKNDEWWEGSYYKRVKNLDRGCEWQRYDSGSAAVSLLKFHALEQQCNSTDGPASFGPRTLCR